MVPDHLIPGFTQTVTSEEIGEEDEGYFPNGGYALNYMFRNGTIQSFAQFCDSWNKARVRSLTVEGSVNTCSETGTFTIFVTGDVEAPECFATIRDMPGSKTYNYGDEVRFTVKLDNRLRNVHSTAWGANVSACADTDFFSVFVMGWGVAGTPRPSYRIGTLRLAFTLELVDPAYVFRPMQALPRVRVVDIVVPAGVDVLTVQPQGYGARDSYHPFETEFAFRSATVCCDAPGVHVEICAGHTHLTCLDAEPHKFARVNHCITLTK
jgi:hypothetical protein